MNIDILRFTGVSNVLLTSRGISSTTTSTGTSWQEFGSRTTPLPCSERTRSTTGKMWGSSYFKTDRCALTPYLLPTQTDDVISTKNFTLSQPRAYIYAQSIHKNSISASLRRYPWRPKGFNSTKTEFYLGG